eukprot:6182952-Pleurochrysis_carterae.AAC.2
MALNPASCRDLAEGEEATEEGVLEPRLRSVDDPPLTPWRLVRAGDFRGEGGAYQGGTAGVYGPMQVSDGRGRLGHMHGG